MCVVPVAISLGSNVGDSIALMQKAVAELSKHLDELVASGIYVTSPLYVEDQPDFHNAMLIAKTNLGPRALLKLLKRIENEVGRTPNVRYGPREIDLDLIAYGSLIYRYKGSCDKDLIVPHPKIPERRFVLEPLYEIAPNYLLPSLPTLEKMLSNNALREQTVSRLIGVKLLGGSS